MCSSRWLEKIRVDGRRLVANKVFRLGFTASEVILRKFSCYVNELSQLLRAGMVSHQQGRRHQYTLSNVASDCTYDPFVFLRPGSMDLLSSSRYS